MLVMAVLLTACGGNTEEMIALQNYVSSIVNRPPGRIEPLPEFVSYEAFTYSAAGMRGPFDIPVDAALMTGLQQGREIRPDPDRRREPLEEFPINTLRMVGSLTRGNTFWVLIQDSEDNIHWVTEGSYLGRNHGRVVAGNERQLNIVEIVPSGAGGYMERPQIITLEE